MTTKYDWTCLNTMQIGRYAEYFAKMEFTLYGFDVYSTEVDDHGIDFVVRRSESLYYDVQVKSSHPEKGGYIFFSKDKFRISANPLAAVVLFVQSAPPEIYLIPSMAWQEPNSLFVDRIYEGLKSKPEWGLNISQRNKPLLAQYRFDEMIQH